MRRWTWGVLLATAVFLLWQETREQKVGEQEAEKPQETAVPVSELLPKQEKKKIALTFDDGPHPIYTEEMLEVLKEKGIPATFFLLGENVEQYGTVVQEIAEQGHLIGNHTYHHVEVTSMSSEEACREIEETNALIRSLTGEETIYIRPPFGSWNAELETTLDLIPVFWSIDTKDWTTQNVDWIVQETAAQAEDHDIILMHDSYASTVEAVRRLVDLLEADGFEFVTVDEIIMD